MKSTAGLPFNPLRSTLYSRDELFASFDPKDDSSYARCEDILILIYFMAYGKNPASDGAASALEALHDNSISLGVQSVIAKRRVVAIMGGHGMSRGTPPFEDVARLAYTLTRAGFLVASGGGPGAMEASHAGAFFAKRDVKDLDAALKQLSTVPDLPKNASQLVDGAGHVDPSIAKALHGWFAPAFALATSLSAQEAEASLGVPTWLYGFEPTSPLASHIGKYFQNSLREDGLVTLAQSGIVYAEGSAGTVQEIFQDAAQNFYGAFCPMVFLSGRAHDYWVKTLPVRPLVEALLGKKPDYTRCVLFTEDPSEAADFLLTR